MGDVFRDLMSSLSAEGGVSILSRRLFPLSSACQAALPPGLPSCWDLVLAQVQL
ncbi:hypothetical protein NQZ68_008704 [Dissostichus eleginoides]|nr:hypothetical protein NQZ68_008704 [Dissostichus eleginoides]